MDTRIELERRGREPSKVTQLTLDNCRTVTTTGISEKLAAYTGLQTLSMINAGLTSLKGFPSLPSLKKLDISDNRLTGGLNHVAESCPKLEFLNLGGNRIKDLETLEPLKQLHELKHLDMYSCDITAVENYQDKIFHLLPQLNDLDGYDRDKKEVFEEDDEEEFGEEDEEDDDDEGCDSDGENDVENSDSDSNDVTNGDDHDEEEEEDDDEVNEKNDSDDEDVVDEETVSATPIVDLNITNPEVEDEDEKLNDDDIEEDEDDEEEEGDEDEDDDDGQSPQEAVAEHRGQKRTHSDDEDDDEEEEEPV